MSTEVSEVASELQREGAMLCLPIGDELALARFGFQSGQPVTVRFMRGRVEIRPRVTPEAARGRLKLAAGRASASPGGRLAGSGGACLRSGTRGAWSGASGSGEGRASASPGASLAGAKAHRASPGERPAAPGRDGACGGGPGAAPGGTEARRHAAGLSGFLAFWKRERGGYRLKERPAAISRPPRSILPKPSKSSLRSALTRVQRPSPKIETWRPIGTSRPARP